MRGEACLRGVCLVGEDRRGLGLMLTLPMILEICSCETSDEVLLLALEFRPGLVLRDSTSIALLLGGEM